ncbi:MAG: hypothetical protein AB7H97_08080 [Pseudobdellovibrionaceae bacterium]
MKEKEWLEDFKAFVDSDGAEVPEEISNQILRKIHRDLNPSAWLVFSKLLGIHALVGTLSLAVCNQFGLNPFHTNFSLSDYFMKFGHSTCMALCGVLFISLTVGLCYVVLRREELFVLLKNAPLQVFGLSILSLAAFVGFGAEIVFGIAVFWFLGAMIGGIVTAKIIGPRPALST